MVSRSHYNDPLGSLALGNSRNWGDASDAVKNEVIAAIVIYGQKYGLSNRDISNLLAIAKVESGFNPDAAARGDQTSASGVFQITDQTATDAASRLNGSSMIGGHSFSGPYDRFDLQSNIEYGIAVYLDKKRIAHSNDVAEIYKAWNTNPSEYIPLLPRLESDSQNYLQQINSGSLSTTFLSIDQTSVSLQNDGKHPQGELTAAINGHFIGTFANSSWSKISGSGNYVSITAHDVTIALPDGVTAIITGDNDTIIAGKNDTIVLTGNHATIKGGDGDNVSVTGDNATISIGANGSAAVRGKSAVINASANDMVNANGEKATINGGTGDRVYLVGDKGQVTVGTGSRLSMSGAGELISAASSQVLLYQNSSATLTGNGNQITDMNGVALTIGAKSVGNSVIAGHGQLTLGDGTNTTLSEVVSETINGGKGVTLTEVRGAQNQMTVGDKATLTLGGVVDTITVNGTGQISGSSEDDILNASNCQISLADTSRAKVIGNRDTIHTGNRSALTITGLYDPVTASNSRIDYIGPNAGDIVSGTGNFGSNWANSPPSTTAPHAASASLVSANQLIQAMASFGVPPSAQTGVFTSNDPALHQPVLAVSH